MAAQPDSGARRPRSPGGRGARPPRRGSPGPAPGRGPGGKAVASCKPSRPPPQAPRTPATGPPTTPPAPPTVGETRPAGVNAAAAPGGEGALPARVTHFLFVRAAGGGRHKQPASAG